MGLINNPQTGGLSGLTQIFKDKGLGDAMSLVDQHRAKYACFSGADQAGPGC